MGLADKGRYMAGLVRKHGFLGLVRKVIEKKKDSFEREYRANYRQWFPSEETLAKQRAYVWETPPVISIVVPAYETPELFLRQLIESVLAQTYDRWELILADGSSTERVEKIALEYAREDKRIRYKKLVENGGISGNTNEGFAMAGGDFIGLLDHDDILSPQALFQVALAIEENPQAQVFYSDEDKVSADLSIHMQAHFKSDFDRELLHSYNYICHFLVFSSKILKETGGLDETYDGSQDYDLVLRLSERTERFVHIPQILYHWRVHGDSTAASSLAKNYAYEAGRLALLAHLKRIGRKADVEPVKGRAFYQVRYKDRIPKERAVRVMPEELLAGVKGLDEAQWLVICDKKHIRKVSADWEETLLAMGEATGAGIVGVRFVDGRHRVMDAGLTRGADGTAVCLFQGLCSWFHGYFDRAVLPRETAGVRLSLCVIRKEVLKEVCGDFKMDGKLLRTVKGNLSFCEAAGRLGYSVLINPQITAVYKG